MAVDKDRLKAAMGEVVEKLLDNPAQMRQEVNIEEGRVTGLWTCDYQLTFVVRFRQQQRRE